MVNRSKLAEAIPQIARTDPTPRPVNPFSGRGVFHCDNSSLEGNASFTRP
jgi:hypothetical protein